MNFILTCTYCANEFERIFYTKESIKKTRCPKCNDKNLKAKQVEDKYTINQYEYDEFYNTKSLEEEDDEYTYP